MMRTLLATLLLVVACSEVNGQQPTAENKGDEAAIRAEERVYRRSGEGFSRRERRDLQRDLNRTSREIYRARHNDR